MASGETVFIDSNIFLYHFTGRSEICRQFLKRCEQGDLHAFTGLTLMGEVCHHLMLAEAISKKLISSKKPSQQMQEKPEIVRQLANYYEQLMNIQTWGIKVLTPPEDLLMKSQIYRSRFGLMTNDSFIPVYMQMAETDKLASNDKTFSQIPSLNVFSPSDITV